MNRNDLSKSDALARISSQMPLNEKRALADAVVDNNGDFEETKEQVRSVLMSGMYCKIVIIGKKKKPPVSSFYITILKLL